MKGQTSRVGIGSGPLPASYLKLACTLVSWLMVNAQMGVVPEQEPDQPVKFTPACGAAVSVTTVPCGNFAEQLLPQLMEVPKAPFGVPLTVPLPPRPMDIP